eukprot:TRINITY_DN3971_c0_g1_i1.p1 TRINITY_DN3971_c0_g1~~TRINITY_DN3971_c0_g1_i1.p1  ORF type:complete len:438 (-),score=63.06 TRINITY_DN3971_c0_g1_i1:64-1377(-)
MSLTLVAFKGLAILLCCSAGEPAQRVSRRLRPVPKLDMARRTAAVPRKHIALSVAGEGYVKNLSDGQTIGANLDTSEQMFLAKKQTELSRTDMTTEASQPSSSQVYGYSGAWIIMVLVVILMFYDQGVVVVSQIIMYVSCLALVKISVKILYDYGFTYPKFTTALHLFVASITAFTVLLIRNKAQRTPIAVPTADEFCFAVLPIALTFGLSIASENQALLSVSAACSEVIAASSPVMSAFLTWLLGMGFELRLLIPIVVVVIGCLLSVQGELNFSAFGVGLLVFACFLRSFKAVMQQKLLTGEKKDKFDPIVLMAWTCTIACVELVVYSAITEGRAPLNALSASVDTRGLDFALVASCVVACMLNMSSLFVIKHLGAVGTQLISQMKSLLVVIGGIALLSESFTAMQFVGFGIIFVGVYLFSFTKRRLASDTKTEQR